MSCSRCMHLGAAGHCKKLEPEYLKLAEKVQEDRDTDLLVITKIDGTVNDSPVDEVNWTGFPTIFYSKAGTNKALLYEGERTAKGLWKYVKKTQSKADEIQKRIDRHRATSKRRDEM